jgi:hypothetical protein
VTDVVQVKAKLVGSEQHGAESFVRNPFSQSRAAPFFSVLWNPTAVLVYRLHKSSPSVTALIQVYAVNTPRPLYL